MKTDNTYQDIGRILFSCSDRPGIVAEITRFLFDFGANIVNLDQHTLDPFGGEFFMRVEFLVPQLEAREAELRSAFSLVAESFDARWRFAVANRKKKLVLYVSRSDHTLVELLYHVRNGDLYGEVKMVISNHADLEPVVRALDIPFHHVPKTAALRDEAERREWELIGGDVDLIVLARYMQILSPQFLARFPNRIINIHHSFLPAFAGADPYSAASERGVKLIGATAHYVTEELDAGPIIEQDVMRVDHGHTVEDMRRIGRSVERAVLTRAVDWHLHDRIIVYQNKTIVFA
ncbi:MAG: formyltetrahydrofolate deformylase [Candidatus Velthaea sp.]|jgi:formyltetrahydrofolate deformylase